MIALRHCEGPFSPTGVGMVFSPLSSILSTNNTLSLKNYSFSLALWHKTFMGKEIFATEIYRISINCCAFLRYNLSQSCERT